MTLKTDNAEKKNFSEQLFSVLNEKQRIIAAAAVLLLFGIVVFGIYYRTFESPFIFDDVIKIRENPDIRLTQLSFKEIAKAGFKSSKTRPVAFISFALNYYFNQYDPTGWHIVNICIHIFVGFFLFLFIRTTLKIPSLKNRFAHPDLIAFGAAFVWLVHPVQTQSVTYIVQRMNSMAALLYLVSFWLYVRGRLVENGSRKWLWFIGATLAWLVSLGCKQITLTLPFLVLLYEWYFFQDLSKDWLKHSLKWTLAVLGLLILIGLIYTNFSPLEKISRMRDFANNEFTLSERALTQLRVVVYYISLLLYPHPSRLNLDHDFPLSTSLFNPFTTFLSAITIVGLIALGLYLAKKHRLISFCIFWYLGNLVIESSVIPLAIIFEHRLYLPSMFVFLPVVILFHRYVKPTWLPVVIACAVAATFSYWTYERNKIWQDDLLIWVDCNKKSPHKARPYFSMGQILTQRGQYDEALANYLKALEINPNYSDAQYNLGILYEKEDQTDKAIERYRRAIQIDPGFVKAYNNLGVILLKQDKTDEAIEYFRKALTIDPNLASAHINLGLALSKKDQPNAAVVSYTKALQINSNLLKAQFQLGSLLLEQGLTEQGIHHLKRSLQIDPEYSEAHNNLGGELLRQGKIDEALDHLTRALSINPNLPQAHNNVGIILMQQGKFDAAISHFQDALRIDPEFALAKKNLERALSIRQTQLDAEVQKLLTDLKTSPHNAELNYRLGNLYLGRGELNNAVAQFEKALALKPNFPEALNNLALAYAAGRQYDRALAAFKKSVELEPDNPSNYYNIAVVSALQDKPDEAMQWLKEAVDKGYRNWELIKSDKDLANIRHLEEYKQLVKGH